MLPYEIKLSVIDRDMAMSYARAVVDTVDYAARGQTDKDKAVHDHYIGKLGEIAAAFLLETKGVQVSQPDFAIHKDKSWDDDLYIDGVGIAVKTQDRELARRFGLSWTFHVNDPILNEPDKIVYFVEYTPELMYVYAGHKIRELTFKPPTLERLIPYKKVVYAADLEGVT